MKPAFEKQNGLVPAIIQHVHTREVLMLGYMNETAYAMTEQSGFVTFWSRSKARLWMKGETSGNRLTVHSMAWDCDQDTLLIQAMPAGPVCHTGTKTCFGEGSAAGFLHHLAAIIEDRKQHPDLSSYTHSLLARGINKVAQKVGEEAVELVIEAKDDNRDLFLGEAADLLYHFLVLLSAKEVSLAEVEALLASRHAAK